MRTKDDVEIFEGKCGCGKTLDKVNYHRPCNLVFCSTCIKTHVCKPVNGPISGVGPGPSVLLPKDPAPAALPACPLLESKRNGNGSHKSTPKKPRKRR